MASKSPEFLRSEDVENEEFEIDEFELEASLAQSMKADLMLMLAGDDDDENKMPILHLDEGNA